MQSLNANSHISVVLVGIVTVLIAECENEDFPIEVIFEFFANSTFLRFLQTANDLKPNLITLIGINNCSIADSAKEDSSIEIKSEFSLNSTFLSSLHWKNDLN